MSAAIPLGLHTVEVECPRCRRKEVMTIVIDVNLVIPRFDIPSLKLKSKSKALDHDCYQSAIPDNGIRIDFSTGEIIEPTEPTS